MPACYFRLVSARREETDAWARASWDGAEQEILAVGARMTLAERLRWLEEASRATRALPSSAAAAEEIAEPTAEAPPGDPTIT